MTLYPVDRAEYSFVVKFLKQGSCIRVKVDESFEVPCAQATALLGTDLYGGMPCPAQKMASVTELFLGRVCITLCGNLHAVLSVLVPIQSLWGKESRRRRLDAIPPGAPAATNNQNGTSEDTPAQFSSVEPHT
eukprot:gb/GECG01006778.1/.p1 GENE.gb/GECG01006778.1/~~gb/GECG01006778.1/.p1  ORF type:complete len:133 (+),score=6.57 gb/GECG01006778.1/:1-399(+)